MASTRKYDQIIAAATRKLEAVQRRETWALLPKEQARLAAYGTVVVAKATRLKSSPSSERGMAQIWAGAEQRYRAEIAAAERAKAQEIEAAAAAKVRRGGWW